MAAGFCTWLRERPCPMFRRPLVLTVTLGSPMSPAPPVTHLDTKQVRRCTWVSLAVEGNALGPGHPCSPGSEGNPNEGPPGCSAAVLHCAPLARLCCECASSWGLHSGPWAHCAGGEPLLELPACALSSSWFEMMTLRRGVLCSPCHVHPPPFLVMSTMV